MKSVDVTIDGEHYEVERGTTVASAVLNAGVTGFRRSVNGEPRSAFCGMGTCFECRLTIDGIRLEKSCQMPVRQGMTIETDEDD